MAERLDSENLAIEFLPSLFSDSSIVETINTDTVFGLELAEQTALMTDVSERANALLLSGPDYATDDLGRANREWAQQVTASFEEIIDRSERGFRSLEYPYGCIANALLLTVGDYLRGVVRQWGELAESDAITNMDLAALLHDTGHAITQSNQQLNDAIADSNGCQLWPFPVPTPDPAIRGTPAGEFWESYNTWVPAIEALELHLETFGDIQLLPPEGQDAWYVAAADAAADVATTATLMWTRVRNYTTPSCIPLFNALLSALETSEELAETWQTIAELEDDPDQRFVEAADVLLSVQNLDASAVLSGQQECAILN